jgi:hypothetical protein
VVASGQCSDARVRVDQVTPREQVGAYLDLQDVVREQAQVGLEHGLVKPAIVALELLLDFVERPAASWRPGLARYDQLGYRRQRFE